MTTPVVATISGNGPANAQDLSQAGFHNDHIDESRDRLIEAASFRDLSTVIVVPAIKPIPPRVVNSWWGMLHPMNQPTLRFFVEGGEVADAYNIGIRTILANPATSKMRFVLTLEHDNIPPPDGHIKVAGEMFNTPYAAIGGLYWTKGEGGMPMIYGDPEKTDPLTFEPQQVKTPAGLQECNGVAMGFTIWDMNLFRDRRLQVEPGVWFVTKQEYVEWKGVQSGTQDLEFCARARKLGYRFAVDTRVRVGHFDASTGQTW